MCSSHSTQSVQNTATGPIRAGGKERIVCCWTGWRVPLAGTLSGPIPPPLSHTHDDGRTMADSRTSNRRYFFWVTVHFIHTRISRFFGLFFLYLRELESGMRERITCSTGSQVRFKPEVITRRMLLACWWVELPSHLCLVLSSGSPHYRLYPSPTSHHSSPSLSRSPALCLIPIFSLALSFYIRPNVPGLWQYL